jgi:hypothetical protein
MNDPEIDSEVLCPNIQVFELDGYLTIIQKGICSYGWLGRVAELFCESRTQGKWHIQASYQ